MPGTVEKYQFMDVNELNRSGVFTRGPVILPYAGFRWPGLAKVRVDLFRLQLIYPQYRPDVSPRVQEVRVSWTRCHFGGMRPWLHCLCGRRVGKLYDSGFCFGCRQCCNLRYASQRRGAKSRRYLQALKLRLRLRLNGIASLAEPFPKRPRRMHRKTYEHLRHRAEKLERDLRHNRRFLLRKTDYSVLAPK